MNLSKVTYTTGTEITSANLNAIQDNIISYCVPNYSSADDGAFLRIIGNKMEWVKLLDAENVAF